MVREGTKMLTAILILAAAAATATPAPTPVVISSAPRTLADVARERKAGGPKPKGSFSDADSTAGDGLEARLDRLDATVTGMQEDVDRAGRDLAHITRIGRRAQAVTDAEAELAEALKYQVTMGPADGPGAYVAARRQARIDRAKARLEKAKRDLAEAKEAARKAYVPGYGY